MHVHRAPILTGSTLLPHWAGSVGLSGGNAQLLLGQRAFPGCSDSAGVAAPNPAQTPFLGSVCYCAPATPCNILADQLYVRAPRYYWDRLARYAVHSGSPAGRGISIDGFGDAGFSHIG